MKNAIKPETDQWMALHEELQDLLAGYADNELDDQQVAIVEAHLSGCENCRNDLARQLILSKRLETIPAPRMSAALHQKLDQALAEGTPAAKHATPRRLWQLPSWISDFSLPTILGAGGWAVALMLSIVMLAPPLTSTNSTEIPLMVRDVVMEYHQLDGKILPVSDATSMGQPPVNWPDARLLSTWNTEVGGAPAQAFAVRSGDNIVIQYRIDETVFFRHPAVRQAVANTGNYRTRTNSTDVLALPLKDAGLLVVGPTGSLPSTEKLTF